jgi:hypothetical protein
MAPASVTSAGASTRIEDVQLSDEEDERLMRGLSPTKLADRDVQEVRGYLEVLSVVFDVWPTIDLTENNIKDAAPGRPVCASGHRESSLEKGRRGS